MARTRLARIAPEVRSKTVTEIDPVNRLPRYISRRAQALPWPDNVPILAPVDVLPYGAAPRDGVLSLWEWLLKVFPPGPDPDDDANLMHDVICNELWHVQTEELGLKTSLSLVSFVRDRTPAEAADLWNRAIARLGYIAADTASAPRPRRRRQS